MKKKSREYKIRNAAKELAVPPGMRIGTTPYSGGRLCVDNHDKFAIIYLRWHSSAYKNLVNVKLHATLRDGQYQDLVIYAPNALFTWEYREAMLRLAALNKFAIFNMRSCKSEATVFVLTAERLGFEILNTYSQSDDDAWQNMREDWLEGCFIPIKIRRKRERVLQTKSR